MSKNKFDLNTRKLNVFYNGRKVGTLALYQRAFLAFEYDKEWIETGFSISPFSLPLRKGVFIPKIDPFEGLYGAFADSLPDGWGRLLVDRMLIKNNIPLEKINMLDRLAIVGNNGMGALSYRPEKEFVHQFSDYNLDTLAEECKALLNTNYSQDLDKLYTLGGSSGGARPKIMTCYDNSDWIIKFPSSLDSPNIGLTEYEYSKCAKKCGIIMSETKLFPSKKCDGYFGTKRFDRYTDAMGNKHKIHMLSVSALLETSHRIPNLDYNHLMKLTLELTKDFEEVEKMFRLMCFNVYAHNRDDHSKNFSFLYNEEMHKWVLSPAYDLTYSNSIGGEHASCVNGNGSNPTITDILEVAKNIGLDWHKSKKIAKEIEEIVKTELVNIK